MPTFDFGPESMDCAKRSGMSKDANTKEITENVDVDVMQNRRVKLSKLTEM